MRSAVVPGVAITLLLGIASSGAAQALGDVAKQEAERRKTVGARGKVYTNESLRPEPAPSGGQPAQPASSAAATATPPAAGADAPAAQPSGAPAAADATPPTEEAWTKRMSGARETLSRSRMFAEALQSRINGLTTEFVNRDDPAQRDTIGAERQKALAELDRVKREIVDQEKAITAVQDEARRAGRSSRLGPIKSRVSSFPVLLVEDKDSLRAMLRHALEGQGHVVLEARDEPEAIQHLRQSRPAVVLTDLKLPSGDGLGVLRAAKELDPELQVVVMTAYGSIQDAVTAMKEGAMDFLAKPVDPDHLILMVERAIAQRRMLSEYTLLKEELAERRGAPRIIGEDPQLKQVSQQLHRAAATDATVLLQGDSGTGKELFARTLHALSPRAEGPFVAINCAAIPENSARDGAVRPREGCLHGRGDAQAGPLRNGAPRDALPRRDRRPAARPPGQDSSRARGKALRARRRHRRRCTSTREWSRPPTGT